MKIGKDHELAAYIENTILTKKCSPAAALACAALEGRTFKTSVCAETIYSYIEKGVFLNLTNEDLPEKARRGKKHHKVRKASRPPVGEIIDNRPESIDYPWRVRTLGNGHRLFIQNSTRRCLLVLTERKTRKEIIILMQDRTAKSTVRALNRP